MGSGTCHPGWRQASPPPPAATREEATALPSPGSLWESSREKCQRGREGVVGSADRDAGKGRRDRPSAAQMSRPERSPPDAQSDALLGPFLWPARVTPATPCFLAHCHTPVALQPPLPPPPGRSRPSPCPLPAPCWARGMVFMARAPSPISLLTLPHLDLQKSPPLQTPDLHSHPSDPQLSPALLLRSLNASFPSPDNSLSLS